MSKTAKTDWKRLDQLKDEQIDTSDIAELGDEFFSQAQLHVPPKQAVTMRLDAGAPLKAGPRLIGLKRPTAPR
ncbi:hypothetical protein AB1286_08200 [Trinickia sp. NRRL B-1857]|uniref:hypothetical protein n=1 Tax=Trinickia sp. NRRL B-1857 TaxID=3162879 RepID=UPI003D2B31BA